MHKKYVILFIISIGFLCSCEKRKEDTSCEAVLTVVNNTGQTIQYSFGSNAYDHSLPSTAVATKDVGHIDIKYSKRGKEISHTSYNVDFETTNFTRSIVVDECNEHYTLN